MKLPLDKGMQAMKQSLKKRMLHILHAEPEITSRIATRITREGVPRYIDWTFESQCESVMRKLEDLRVGEFTYKFASSSSGPSLYGSIYACMILGIYGKLDTLSSLEKSQWIEYLDSFQSEHDGYFRDPVLAGDAYEGSPMWGDGWGIRHLAGHIIIAYARLGGRPKYQFRFLEPYYDKDYLEEWLEKFHFAQDVWSQSNYVMNLYILLQYVRDFMEEPRAVVAIECVAAWLLGKQREDTGMWHDYEVNGYPELGDAIRGAYHYYPLFTYEQIEVPHRERVIDTILLSQNSWGGFNPDQQPSGACADIDALEPLIRFSYQTGYRNEDVKKSVQSAFVWILSSQNVDGGFEDIPEHGCHYGAHPLTTSKPGESNLFSTWFRSLCLAYAAEFLELGNGFKLHRIPGYEIRLGKTS